MPRIFPSSSPRTLSDALDLSYLNTPVEIRKRFTQLAECLLLHSKLCIDYFDGPSNQIRTFEFQLLEIEFYLYFPIVHEDPFCHNHVNQTQSGQWYFHRARGGEKEKTGDTTLNKSTKVSATKSGGYRGGTRKGVDLVFGNPVTSSFFPPSSTIHGGILLRSMRSLSSKNEVISGPSLLVDKILELTCSENIAELVNHKLDGHVSAIENTLLVNSTRNASLCFRLLPEEQASRLLHPPFTAGTIGHSPRVGLDLSHPSVSPIPSNTRVKFIGKMYRFFISPNVLKASSRFYNLIPYCKSFIDHLGEETIGKATAENLIALCEKETSINRTSLEKYVAAFLDGYQKKDLKMFVGSSGKGVSANPVKMLTLVGVLCRLGSLEED